MSSAKLLIDKVGVVNSGDLRLWSTWLTWLGVAAVPRCCLSLVIKCRNSKNSLICKQNPEISEYRIEPVLFFSY